MEILDPGLLTTVQDQGRPGQGRWGLAESGAVDRGSLRLANRLVGNPEQAAGLEITFGGLRARFDQAATVAVTGAVCEVRVGSVQAHLNGPLRVPADAELRVGRPTAGLRSYVAVRGGLDVPKVLGSRSTDVGAGVGLPPLAGGDRLALGTSWVGHPGVDVAAVATPSREALLHGVLAARIDLFDADARAALTTTCWTVSADSDRVGLRLVGAPLIRLGSEEMFSEGTLAGAVEVPPDGQPIVFLNEYPSTCGYPVVAVLDRADLDVAGQLVPGARVRLQLDDEPVIS